MQELWGKKTWRDASRVLGDRTWQEATGFKKGERLWLGPAKGAGRAVDVSGQKGVTGTRSGCGMRGLGVKTEILIVCDN